MVNPIILKILPFALLAGAAYYFIFKPVQAAAQPAVDATKIIKDASAAVGEAVDAGVDTVEDVVESVFSPESFERPAGTGGGLVEEIFKLGAEAQRAVTGGLTWREQAVLDERTNVEALTSLIHDIDAVAPRPKADSGTVNETGALNIANTFGDQAIADRLTKTIQSTIQGNYSSPFGGYGSAVNQEAELRKAIEESKSRYGEWFV